MAEKVNGWTISSHTTPNGTVMWKAVNKAGTIGIQNENKGAVVSYATRTDANKK